MVNMHLTHLSVLNINVRDVNEWRHKKTCFGGFPPGLTQAVQLQKMATRGLKFRIQKAEGLYYLCSENKGAVQLCSYQAANRAADLHLCFCICKK